MKRRTMMLLTIILIALMTQASTCFDFIKPYRGPESQDIVDDLIDESDPDDQPLKLNLPEDDDTTVQEDQQESEVFSFASEYENLKYQPFDEVLEIMGIFDSRTNIDFHVDTVGDNIYADPSVEPGGYQPFTDIIGWGSAMLQFRDTPVTPSLYEIWPRGYSDYLLNSWTVYPYNWQPYDGNQWYWTFIILDGDVPFTHSSLTCTYASVAVTDDNPDNDFNPMVQYPWDFNQFTDRWDTMWQIPGENWSYMATGENFAEIPTSGFGFYYQNVVGWFYSGDDIDPMYFAYRLWGHCINLDWDISTSGADSINSDPTIDPVPVSADAPVYFYDGRGRIIALSDGYTMCDRGLCSQEPSRAWEEGENWCECTGCTNIAGCDCHMFSHDPSHMTLASLWNHVAGPGEKYTKQENLRYSCFCAKPSE